MEISIRKNHELRLKAFDLMSELKNKNVPRKEIDKIHEKFGISIMTLYDWYKGKFRPYGRKGEFVFKSELFYVLGALLGDGCIYNWKTTNHYIILVGDSGFTAKYADRITECIGTKTKHYINRSNNTWFVRSNNFKLYSLFKKVREDLIYLEYLIKDNEKQSSISFIEGFFDAEGCVKIIKEKVRKTPKICLDITNTNFEVLDLIRRLLKEHLGIEAKYSIQKADGVKNKQIAYHLRIYKKEFVRKFFENINTTKLKEEKVSYVENWLKLNENASKHSGSSSQPVTN